MLVDWGIERSKCHVFLRDESSSMKKAFEDSGFCHANCGAHTLSLITSSISGDKKVSKMLEKCRRLVGHFNHSNLASDRLREEQEREGMEAHRLKQDMPTRWWTKEEMGKSLLEQRGPITLYLARYNHHNLELNDDEWELLAKIMKLLGPLTSASKQMCRDSEMLSAQFPIARGLYAVIESIEDDDLQRIRALLLGRLVDKFDVENIKSHGLSMFLDARFKNRYASNRVDFNGKIRHWLQDECSYQENYITELVSPPTKKKIAGNSFFAQQLYEDDKKVGSEDVLKEMDSYLSKRCIQTEEDPLKFCKENQKHYFHLAAISRRYLSAPATSIASEGTFSEARDVFDYRRTNLLQLMPKCSFF